MYGVRMIFHYESLMFLARKSIVLLDILFITSKVGSNGVLVSSIFLKGTGHMGMHQYESYVSDNDMAQDDKQEPYRYGLIGSTKPSLYGTFWCKR